jgi:hypothetical protein
MNVAEIVKGTVIMIAQQLVLETPQEVKVLVMKVALMVAPLVVVLYVYHLLRKRSKI